MVDGEATPEPTVESYLDALPEGERQCLEDLRRLIRECVPTGTTERISYGIPSFHYKGGLVWYAGFKSHCSLYPVGPDTLAEFASLLNGYATSNRGTLRFTAERPLPEEFVRTFVATRVAENEAAAAEKEAKKRAKRAKSASATRSASG
jgi:uncharacterized protein YdhG (YjbR/CyaY superfamily)